MDFVGPRHTVLAMKKAGVGAHPIPGRIQDLDLGGQGERLRRKDRGAAGAQSIWDKIPHTPSPNWGGVWRGVSPRALPRKYFHFGSRNAYFGAFSRQSEYLLLHCRLIRPDLQYASPA